jgi:hypothetical protein
MNTSMLTASIARGLAIYAEYMDMPSHGPSFARCETRWNEWKASHPKLWRYVTETHNTIFEDVLAFGDALD